MNSAKVGATGNRRERSARATQMGQLARAAVVVTHQRFALVGRHPHQRSASGQQQRAIQGGEARTLRLQTRPEEDRERTTSERRRERAGVRRARGRGERGRRTEGAITRSAGRSTRPPARALDGTRRRQDQRCDVQVRRPWWMGMGVGVGGEGWEGGEGGVSWSKARAGWPFCAAGRLRLLLVAPGRTSASCCGNRTAFSSPPVDKPGAPSLRAQRVLQRNRIMCYVVERLLVLLCAVPCHVSHRARL